MFSATAVPDDDRSAPLRALRVSLNTPVVAIDGLPVGPARAAIALQGCSDGPRLTVALRSVRARQVVCFGPDSASGPVRGSRLALERALSFAEGMGFLFDEDCVAAGVDPDEAVRTWREFLAGEAELEAAPAAPPALTKFRLAGGAVVPVRADTRDPQRDLWVRLLSRF